MLKWIGNLVYRWEHARHLQTRIEGLSWRAARSYPCDPDAGDDPIEDADRLMLKLRRRY